MKKILLLSLLLITPITHSMEKEKKGICSILSDMILGEQSSEEEHFTINDNDPMEKERNTLDARLAEAHLWRGIEDHDPRKYLVICRYPEHVYGYTEDNGAGDFFEGKLINYDSKTLAKMHSVINARYNGYSGLTALLLSSETRNTKKHILHNLRCAGMEPTDNDKKMAEYLKQSKLLNRS